jgi:phospholipid-binding lipoprotein MlaA
VSGQYRFLRKPGAAIAALASFALLAGCAVQTPAPGEINDPNERVNRQVHAFNKGVDRVVFRPVSNAYGVIAHPQVRRSVTNFSHYAGTPGDIINGVLQGDIEGSLHNTFRFLVNTTLGVFGIFDPATEFGLQRRSTDFGETLYVWGVPEGPYQEVPALGPYTTRHFAGVIVDQFLNPLAVLATPPESYAPLAAYVGDQMSDRYQFADTVDSILYLSADSYAQARQAYLSNRRFELGQGGSDTYIDPYEELFNDN